jgi:hypothetical protein
MEKRAGSIKFKNPFPPETIQAIQYDPRQIIFKYINLTKCNFNPHTDANSQLSTPTHNSPLSTLNSFKCIHDRPVIRQDFKIISEYFIES